MKTKVWSFDVFDTVLCRSIARPGHVMYFVAEAALKQRGGAYSDTDIHEVAHLRHEVEHRVRSAAGAEDISLAAIYDGFSELSFYGLEASSMMELELEFEDGFVYPVAEIVHTIARLRQQNKRIIFISDMYLSADTVRHMLAKYGIIQDGDGLYMSGDLGLTKARGTLFDEVCRREEVKPGEVFHTGDNELSDVLSGIRRGLKTKHYKVGAPGRFEVIPHYPATPLYLNSVLAGTIRATRLSAAPGFNPALVAIVSGVVAPLLYGFTYWVLTEAQAAGKKRLYFVSRDGWILHHIARTIQKHSNAFDELQLEYLYGSRQAWFLASVEKFTPEAEDWLFVKGHPRTPATVFAKLNISREEAGSFLTNAGLQKFWQRELKGDELIRFKAVLFQSDLTQLVEKKATAARARMERYLSEQGVRGDITLVDIGWTLKTQRAFARIIGSTTGGSVDGYYLGLLGPHLFQTEAGPYRAFFNLNTAETAGNDKEINLFRHYNLVEQIFTMADHGSVTGYGEDGKPILKDAGHTQAQTNYLGLLQTLTASFAEKLAPFAGLPVRQIADTALQNLWLLTKSPTRAEAKSLAWVQVGDDQNESSKLFYGAPYRLIDLVYQILFIVTRNPAWANRSRFRFWPVGSVKAAWFPVRLLQSILSGSAKVALTSAGRLRQKLRYVKAYLVRIVS